MALEVARRLIAGVWKTDVADEGGGGGGSSPAIAIMKLSAQITNWDGNPLPFDVTLLDADGLWDAVNHQFVAKAAGWYRVGTFGTNSSRSQIFSTAISGTGTASLDVIVTGAGDNLYANFGEHTAVADGIYFYPQIVGITHLEIGDSLDLESANHLLGLTVPVGFCFFIERVVAT